MSLLIFYNPYILPDYPNVIECIISYGDSIAIGKGTHEFMEGLLQDIGVQAQVLRWTMQVCRSKYYCEYQGGEDWQDHWPLIWKTRIETAQTLGSLPIRSFPFEGTDAFDSTWFSEKQPSRDTIVNCLIISDFNGENERKKAQNLISETVSNGKLKELREQYSADLPNFSYCEILGKYQQLQIDLGKFPGSFFAQGADYAEAVIELCKKSNGTVNFRDRL